MIDASVVIVSYNTRELLRDCLNSLAGGGGDLAIEIFVVDNASADGSADMVAAEFPAVGLIRKADNPGFAAANNIALREAKGRHVILLNPDTVVRPGAFVELVRFMDGTPAAGYCGPRLLNADGSHQPSARRFPTVLTEGFAMAGLARRYPASRHTIDLHATHGDGEGFRADWLSGACLVVRTEAMRQVGMLDDGYFLYFEETDWCRRLAEAGWEGWYVPSAEVVHYGGQSAGSTRADAPFFGNHPAYWLRSRRRYLRRHKGFLAVVASDALDVTLNSLLWLRHRWRAAPESRMKVRRASTTLRYLFGRSVPAR